MPRPSRIDPPTSSIAAATCAAAAARSSPARCSRASWRRRRRCHSETVAAKRRLMAVEEGEKAPAFSMSGNDGKTHKLTDHKGKRVVLYFYPRDLTPGCTTEACDFRDNLARIKKAGAVVYGVSKDSLASHDKFR